MKKRRFFLSLFCFLCWPGFGQHEKFTYGITITADQVNNLHGGIKRGSGFLSLLDVNMNYSPDKGFLKNTEFFLRFLKTAGKPFSERYIGDVQVASNIEGSSSLFFYEIGVVQKMGSFSVLAGMNDLNSLFYVSDHSGMFINSSFGISPALSLNLPLSVFPVTTFGAVFRLDQDRYSVLTGFYNLNEEFSGEKFVFRDHFFREGFLNMTEFQFRLEKSQLKAGFFYERRWKEKEVPGFYLLADHTFYKNITGEKSVNGFVQVNLNMKKNDPACGYTGTGITLNGFFSKKHNDVTGIAVARVRLNTVNENTKPEKNCETAVELSHQISVTEKFLIQPDFQYILNPAGMHPDSFTGILRIKYLLH